MLILAYQVVKIQIFLLIIRKNFLIMDKLMYMNLLKQFMQMKLYFMIKQLKLYNNKLY